MPKAVRRTGTWQDAIDDRILEHLDDNYLEAPTEIANAVPIPVTTYVVGERLRVLSQAAYVAPYDDDYDLYELTDLGRAYLRGRARADCLWPTPSSRRPGHVLG